MPLDEIWEGSIMTNFESNWDYIKHKPKQSILVPSRSYSGLLQCFNQKKQFSDFRLEDFWKFGIPDKYRKVLWPFAI